MYKIMNIITSGKAGSLNGFIESLKSSETDPVIKEQQELEKE